MGKTKKESEILEDVPQGATGTPPVSDPHGWGSIWKLFEAFKDHFHEGAALIAIAGYIIISAFGEIHFFEYLIFISIVFLAYSCTKEAWTAKFFKWGFFTLLVYLFFDKFEFVELLFEKVDCFLDSVRMS